MLYHATKRNKMKPEYLAKSIEQMKEDTDRKMHAFTVMTEQMARLIDTQSKVIKAQGERLDKLEKP